MFKERRKTIWFFIAVTLLLAAAGLALDNFAVVLAAWGGFVVMVVVWVGDKYGRGFERRRQGKKSDGEILSS